MFRDPSDILSLNGGLVFPADVYKKRQVWRRYSDLPVRFQNAIGLFQHSDPFWEGKVFDQMLAENIIEFIFIAERKPFGGIQVPDVSPPAENIRIQPPVKDVLAASEVQFPHIVIKKIPADHSAIYGAESLTPTPEQPSPRGSRPSIQKGSPSEIGCYLS